VKRFISGANAGAEREAMSEEVNLSLDQVYELTMEVLVGSGASKANAAPVARSIREAEADNLRNIGLGYLPLYCEHLRCGKVDGRAVPEVTQTAPATLYVDAKQGFAHPAIELGRDRLLEMVRQIGIAAMGVGNSYACGVLGHLVEPLAREGLLAMVFANAPAIIAPWGGKKPVFGTNPMAVAIPSAGRPPVVIDQSSSMTAKVSIFERQAKGQELEPGWAIDRQGNPTLDPTEALQGSMLPMGGYKGSNLALLVETFAAGLTGANWSYAASAFNDNLGGPPRTGQFMLAFNPALFGGSDFSRRIEELFGEMLSQEGTQLPSDERLRARKQTVQQGVMVDQDLMNRLEGYK
jgi:(2R)-3-sulfolactate dehydrogenase (NADP+)